MQVKLQRFEDEHSIRACMNRYMYLCDNLDAGFDLAPLMELFTEDAIWQGKGKRYGATFGAHEGMRKRSEQCFAKYTRPPAHFETNVHFLTSELIEVNRDQAQGSWVLLQTSNLQ